MKDLLMLLLVLILSAPALGDTLECYECTYNSEEPGDSKHNPQNCAYGAFNSDGIDTVNSDTATFCIAMSYTDEYTVSMRFPYEGQPPDNLEDLVNTKRRGKFSGYYCDSNLCNVSTGAPSVFLPALLLTVLACVLG